jgi:hypothetical protein
MIHELKVMTKIIDGGQSFQVAFSLGEKAIKLLWWLISLKEQVLEYLTRNIGVKHCSTQTLFIPLENFQSLDI